MNRSPKAASDNDDPMTKRAESEGLKLSPTSKAVKFVIYDLQNPGTQENTTNTRDDSLSMIGQGKMSGVLFLGRGPPSLLLTTTCIEPMKRFVTEQEQTRLQRNEPAL